MSVLTDSFSKLFCKDPRNGWCIESDIGGDCDCDVLDEDDRVSEFDYLGV